MRRRRIPESTKRVQLCRRIFGRTDALLIHRLQCPQLILCLSEHLVSPQKGVEIPLLLVGEELTGRDPQRLGGIERGPPGTVGCGKTDLLLLGATSEA